MVSEEMDSAYGTATGNENGCRLRYNRGNGRSEVEETLVLRA